MLCDPSERTATIVCKKRQSRPRGNPAAADDASRLKGMIQAGPPHRRPLLASHSTTCTAALPSQ